MKKILCICISLLMAVMLPSCSKASSHIEDDVVCSFNRPTFDTVSGLLDHLNTIDVTIKDEIQSNQADTRNTNSDVLRMYSPSFEPFGYQLNNVALSGTWIYYEYYAEGYSLETPLGNSSVLQSQEADLDENTSTPPSTLSGLQGYDSESYQVTDLMLAEIENTFTIGWDYRENSGNGCWEEFARINFGHVFEFEEYPGVYYSNTPFTDQVYGKMLYWSQDGYAFQASMSLDVFNSITFSADGIPELVEAVDYSTKTLKAIE